MPHSSEGFNSSSLPPPARPAAFSYPVSLMTPTKPIPVSILTGFLGAGKTTLLNYILKQQHDYKFAVIINEVGKIGVDGQLVETQREEVVEMSNGCLCCTVRKDLVQGVQNLLKKGGFDYLLIETTGIAEPGPIAQTFLNIPQLQKLVRMDSIITVVDAEQITKQLVETETAREQVTMADFLLLNKTDLVDEAQLHAVEEKLRELNTHATVFRTNQSQVNLRELLDMHAFDVDQKLAVDPRFLDELSQRHHHEINSVSLVMDKPFSIEALELFVKEMSEKEKIYRSKGFLWIKDNPRRAIFHGVNNRFTLLWDRLWEKGEPRSSQLVFIGKQLEESKLRKEMEKCTVR
jgi:G3E family GTPase